MRLQQQAGRLAPATRRSASVKVVARASNGQGAGAARRRARGPEDLVDPAQIGASGTANTRVNDFGGSVSLNNYMQLPVEQYFVLDPSQISFLGNNRFLLKVPRLNILNVWLEPEVEISVVTTRSRVSLQAENCRIRGSELIESMRLDERFALRFATELSWTSVAEATSSRSSTSSMDGAVSQPLALGQGRIMGTCKLDVWSEVIPPFNLMPREMLQSTCNVVMRGLVGSLLPLFVRMLGEDYERWAKDEQYRTLRAARSKPLTEPVRM